jgi:hypothetical protein
MRDVVGRATDARKKGSRVRLAALAEVAPSRQATKEGRHEVIRAIKL